MLIETVVGAGSGPAARPSSYGRQFSGQEGLKGGKGKGKDIGGNKGKGKGKDSKGKGKGNGSGKSGITGACFNCGKTGQAAECWSKKKDGGNSKHKRVGFKDAIYEADED